MRKYLIGFLAGILIATAGVAAADTVSMIGKKIQSEAIVTLDGEEIGTALIVDGTSYPPLRTVAEAVGVGVGWEKGVVKLETQTSEKKSAAYWESTIERLTWYLDSTNKLVDNTKSSIETGKQIIEKWQTRLDGLADDASEKIITEYTNTITTLQAGQMEKEVQLSEYQAKVAEIESDLALAKTELAEAQAQ